MNTSGLTFATYIHSAALLKGNLNTSLLELQYDTVQEAHVPATALLENSQNLKAWDR